jgi:dTMP kinase
VLDVTSALAAERHLGPPDRLERAGAEFHAAVRQAYRDLAAERGWIVVDGSGDEDEVAERVWQAVNERVDLAS